MTLKITNSTDRKFIGVEFDDSEFPIQLKEDYSFFYDEKKEEDGVFEFSNSNYVIECEIIHSAQD
jgi:hypothetical protein